MKDTHTYFAVGFVIGITAMFLFVVFASGCSSKIGDMPVTSRPAPTPNRGADLSGQSSEVVSVYQKRWVT